MIFKDNLLIGFMPKFQSPGIKSEQFYSNSNGLVDHILVLLIILS